MSNIQIIPAILATSRQQFEKDLAKITAAESLNDGWIHIDFADNKFVQNETISPKIVQEFPCNLRKEAHLMVVNPKDWIDSLIEAGFERVIIHLESDQVVKAVDYANSKGLQAGLAIKNETDVGNLDPFAGKINTVLIMSIIPGFQGQQFILGALKKVKEVAQKNWGVRLGVDGAVSSGNITDILRSEANFVVVGSYLLTGDINQNLENLWEAVNE